MANGEKFLKRNIYIIPTHKFVTERFYIIGRCVQQQPSLYFIVSLIHFFLPGFFFEFSFSISWHGRYLFSVIIHTLLYSPHPTRSFVRTTIDRFSCSGVFLWTWAGPCLLLLAFLDSLNLYFSVFIYLYSATPSSQLIIFGTIVNILNYRSEFLFVFKWKRENAFRAYFFF